VMLPLELVSASVLPSASLRNVWAPLTVSLRWKYSSMFSPVSILAVASGGAGGVVGVNSCTGFRPS